MASRLLIKAARGSSTLKPTRLKMPSFTLYDGDISISSSSLLSSPSLSLLKPAQYESSSKVLCPSTFHSYLCERIKKAEKRVVISSLYIGTGGDKVPLEKEFLSSLSIAASSSASPSIKILLDANRACRPVGASSSLKAVLAALSVPSSPSTPSSNITVTNSPSVSLLRIPTPPPFPPFIPLPSPIDEVGGVMHLKAYIIDDEILLSGANLSEEYFSSRMDRYLLLKNGAGGLVDFYAELIETLSNADCSESYYPVAEGEKPTKLPQSTSTSTSNIEDSISTLLEKHTLHQNTTTKKQSQTQIATATPTLQFPASMVPRGRPTTSTIPSYLRRDPLPRDSEIIKDIVRVSPHLEGHTIANGSWIGLSSAYLNPTVSMVSVMKTFCEDGGYLCCLTAGGVSHGFAPKPKPKAKSDAALVTGSTDSSDGIGRGWIPKAYMSICRNLNESLKKNARVLLFERAGWTFHAKGLWISSRQNGNGGSEVDEEGKRKSALHGGGDADSLLAIVVGSGNYNERSENLDLESNCVIVLNDSGGVDDRVDAAVSEVRRDWVNDWNSLCKYSQKMQVGVGGVGEREESNPVNDLIFRLTRRFL